jgi:hypothetical protein
MIKTRGPFASHLRSIDGQYRPLLASGTVHPLVWSHKGVPSNEITPLAARKKLLDLRGAMRTKSSIEQHRELRALVSVLGRPHRVRHCSFRSRVGGLPVLIPAATA